MGDLVDQPFQGLLHFPHPALEQRALLDQDILPALLGALALAAQRAVFDQRLDLHPGGTHTLDQLDPPAGRFVKIPHAALGPGHRGNEADTFIRPQGVAGQPGLLYAPKSAAARFMFSVTATPKGHRFSHAPHWTHSPALWGRAA